LEKIYGKILSLKLCKKLIYFEHYLFKIIIIIIIIMMMKMMMMIIIIIILIIILIIIIITYLIKIMKLKIFNLSIYFQIIKMNK